MIFIVKNLMVFPFQSFSREKIGFDPFGGFFCVFEKRFFR